MKTVNHKFVKYIPDPESIQEGVVYISLKYDTAVHNCFCGCGHQVVTPLSPSDWKITYNGESVSLHPSIGNWSYECRSHYWIKKGKVIWAEDWSEDRIQANRDKDSVQKKLQINSTDSRFKKLKDFFQKVIDRLK